MSDILIIIVAFLIDICMKICSLLIIYSYSDPDFFPRNEFYSERRDCAIHFSNNNNYVIFPDARVESFRRASRVNMCFALRIHVGNCRDYVRIDDYQEAISQDVLAGLLGSRSRFTGKTTR